MTRLRIAQECCAALHENYSADDERRGDREIKSHLFIPHNPAEQDGDDGVDVSMRGDESGREVFEEPYVRGESDDRAKDDHVAEREPGARRDSS